MGVEDSSLEPESGGFSGSANQEMFDEAQNGQEDEGDLDVMRQELADGFTRLGQAQMSSPDRNRWTVKIGVINMDRGKQLQTMIDEGRVSDEPGNLLNRANTEESLRWLRAQLTEFEAGQ